MRMIILSLMALCLVGCRSPEGNQRWPGNLVVGQQKPAAFRPDQMRIAPRSLPASADDQKLVREITARRDEIFAHDPPQHILDQAELIFLTTGHLPELLRYYEEAIAKADEPSALLARAGWLYERLGVDDLAMERAQAAVKAMPDDPFAHFALAYCYGQQAERYDDAYPKMIAHLGKVFALDPDFQVSGVVGRDALREEYNRIREEHGVDAPPAPTGDAGPAAPVNDPPVAGAAEEPSADSHRSAAPHEDTAPTP